MILHEFPFSKDLKDSIQSGFLREIIHNQFNLNLKIMIIYILGSIYIIACLVLIVATILIVNNDQLLRKGHIIIEHIFKGYGQILLIVNYIIFIPSLMIFAETSRCQYDDKSQYYFNCLNKEHLSSLSFAVISSFFCFALVTYFNLFVNSQFPNEHIPFCQWNTKPKVAYVVWQLIYVFHYDILDQRYHILFRISTLSILIYQYVMVSELPRPYVKFVYWSDQCRLAVLIVLNFVIVLQDFLSVDVMFEHFPVIVLLCIISTGILITKQSERFKIVLSRDNRDQILFQSETDMELYMSLLFLELEKLKSPEKGIDHSSTPQIFTIISKHMEHCRNDECICKKYEPEYDKKFSSIGSRRLTMRQSTSFSSVDYMMKKKFPIKISYDTKTDIFLAEIADCIDRFLQQHPKSVGLKLQKSFFNHQYMNSSYKALFVQLENSHSCNSFRGKINIYHLKTKIQEEMVQSEASPFSMDITTCLKFESKRVLFEQRIIDLCLVCESFWNELIQNQDDYNVEKIHELILEIAQTIIEIKSIYSQLCFHNPQNVDVIQNYALIYRYILRDEFRFNDIINNLNQLKKTNKLEQIRELTPKFFDSDNYAMIIVAGDIKDLGRVIKANRGVEQIFGYMPNELQGYKINKVMPRLYAQVHDDFISNFLKRGHSNFIDKNQFLLIENKMRFIQMTLAYIKPLVDLKMGLMLVSFFKLPLKVPNNTEMNNYVKSKDAHYILCDSKGQIFGMSHNCMKNLGIPPTIISKSKENSLMLDSQSLYSIDQFSPKILDPDYEFDLPKGMNFTFDTTIFKSDKYLTKEFHELTGRMRKYNIFISLKKQEYKLSPTNLHEVLLFTIEILSFQLSEAPITIPVDKTDDHSYSQYSGTTVSSVNNDEMRTSKFKEFKTQVQDLRNPTKIALLKKITIAFCIFLLAVFSLNYALCATQNNSYMQRLEVLDLLFELTDRIPQQSRYMRTCVNIANGFENNTNEIIQDRFSYYMKKISDNSQIFNDLQQNVFTKYKSQLSLDDVTVLIQDIQSDYTIKTIKSSIASALNIYSSKSLQFSKLKMPAIRNLTIPFLSFDFKNQNLSQQQLTSLQQDLYYLILNGHDSIPKGLIQLNDISQQHIEDQSYTFMMISLVIGIVSIFVNFIIIPIVFPLLVHYEKLAYYILHSVNKLTSKFVENEVKSCNQLFNYIGKKQGSGISDKPQGAMLKKPDARKENKQLMKINPKIPKHVLEQEKRKKRHSRRTHRSRRDYEEEKINVESLDNIDHTRMDDDEGSGLLDEQLDEDHQTRGNRQQSRSNAAQVRSRVAKEVYRPRRRTVAAHHYHHHNQMSQDINTGSVGSIDESTIQTSIEMNSSTNKSSGDDTSSDREEESYSQSSSSQSNYTHYTNVSQWKNLRQNGYSNAGNIGLKSNASIAYDMTHAKPSELPAGDTYLERENNEALSEEEKEFKKQIRERQQKIKQSLKRRKLKKIFYLVIFVIVISIYLGVNTMYTRFVFDYEDFLQGNINIIDQRILCYPYSITLIKELVARNKTIKGWNDEDIEGDHHGLRTQLLQCYQKEKTFSDMVQGHFTVNNQQILANQYQSIAQSLGKNQLCSTLYQLTSPAKYIQCIDAYDGINQLGLVEVVNLILREGEKIIINYEDGNLYRNQLISILRDSSLNKIETVKDIFIDDALKYQRDLMINEIKKFASNLFRIFDILFAAFVAFCFIMVIIGVMIIIRRLKNLILQIYHIVLLIPYGERTKRELNELLKISL